MERFKIGEDTLKLITKIIIPAIVVSFISIAVEIKHKTAKFWNSLLSILISVGGAYLFSDYILATVPAKYIVLIVSLVAILVDKLMSWILFEFNVGGLMDKLTEIGLNWLKNKVKK